MEQEQYDPDDVRRKALEIDASGLSKLQAGKVEPFVEFDSKLVNKGGAYLEFTWGSNRRYQELLEQVERASKPLGILFLTAVRDYPAHITIQETPALVSHDARTDLAQFFWVDRGWLKFRQYMIGREIFCNTLARDGGNLLLLASVIHPSIPVLRSEFDRKCAARGWETKPFPPLCHSSAARMIVIPDDRNFGPYLEAIEPIRESLKSDPLVLKVSGVHLGNTYDFLTGRD